MVSLLRRCLAVLCLFPFVLQAPAQSTPSVQADRVAAHANLRVTTRLAGHVPAWATSANDAGAVPPDTSLHLTFVLSRSPELQAAFTQLLADQQNPASPHYHQWLTPQQVGTLYGPTQHDLDALTTWLNSQGLSVTEVAPSRVFVTVVAPASTVANALATSFHYFTLKDESRRATTANPAIPSAFAALVTSISGLADIPIHPTSHVLPGSVPFSGVASPATASSPTPLTTVGSAHYLSPNDFRTIYDLNPTLKSGIDGTGQKIAIIGRSRVLATDISIFESHTGLPSTQPNVVIPAGGADPGITGDANQAEATLDVTRVIGTAPGAQVDLVITTAAAGDVYLAAQYEVQTLLDPVMNISFSSCESSGGASDVSTWDTLFSQAASEGISTFISSGDSGAAGCEAAFSVPVAPQVLSISEICSSSYVTCVGGTEFADTASPSTYWSTSNDSTLESALSYIPEGAWNEPTATNSTGNTIYVDAGTGGGASAYITKPTWQAGPGVPADGFRDVPDVSFSASGHDGYLICITYDGSACTGYSALAGTSAAAPAMAGVAALLNQKIGSAQGNLNPLFYRLAANSTSAFHDAAPASSGVSSCDINTPSMCNNSTPSSTALTGGLAGFPLTTGYDQATGLGSLDITSFLTAAALPVTATTTTLSILSPIVVGSSTTSTVTVAPASTSTSTPTGQVEFFQGTTLLGSSSLSGSSPATASYQGLPFNSAGSFSITAVYEGDSNFLGSVSSAQTLVVNKGIATTTLAAVSTTLTVGSSDIFTATVSPTSSGTVLPSGTVQFLQGSTILGTATVAGGTATLPAQIFSTVGTFSITANYSGDSNFSAATSAAQTIVVTQATPAVTLTATATTLIVGGTDTFTATVTHSGTITPTGTVQLLQGTTSLGTATLSSGRAIFTQAFSTVGSFPITASYSGDSNYTSATSSAITVVVNPVPTYQLSASPSSLSLSAGATTNNTSTINLGETNGFTGTVNLSCAVAYTGTATLNYTPTCNLASSVSISGAPASTTLTVGTTVPHAIQGTNVVASLGERTSILFAACLLCLLPVRRRLSWKMLSILFLLTTAIGGLSGCGGSGGTTSTPQTLVGTTTGSYTITVTANSPNAANNPAPATIALTVN